MPNPLYDIPGLGGYLASQDRRRAMGQQDMQSNLQQIKLADLLNTSQKEREMQKVLGSLTPEQQNDPEYMRKLQIQFDPKAGLVPPKPDLGTNDMRNAAAIASTIYDKGTPEWNNEFKRQMLEARKSKGTRVTTNVGVGGTMKDIPKFRHDVQTTIKPQLDTSYAADQALTAIDDSIKTGNFIGFQAARVQLAKAMGDSQISKAEIQAAGGDPSILGGMIDTTSTLFTGTPSLDTQNRIKQTLKALQSVARNRANQEINVQKQLAKRNGYSDQEIEEALRFDQLSGKKTITLKSGKVIEVED